MTTVLIKHLDPRTNNDLVKLYCQTFGRVLNCYTTSDQCIVTFAEQKQAEDFIRSSPHRLDSYSYVNATLKTMKISQQFDSSINLNEQCRLIVRGTSEQLNEKLLVDYFSTYGSVRMCLVQTKDNCAVITFDQSQTCQRVLTQSRHFLQGRSLSVEFYSSSNKRRKHSLNAETSKSISSQDNYLQEQIRFDQNEREQWQIYLNQQRIEYEQTMLNYQTLLQQIVIKDRQIDQLKQENKDVDQILRQTIHDAEQQQIQFRKREETHQQTKRKYEELYKSYLKLKNERDSIGHVRQT